MRGDRDGGPTRRGVLLGGAALMASAGMPVRRARAEEALRIGEASLTVLSDGHLTLPMGFVLPGREHEEIAALLAPHGMATDALRPDCNVTLLRTGDRLVLFDAGAGPLFQDTAGRLPESLEAAGIDPAEVTDVVFTHGHPDHLWGVVDDFDELVFGEATYHVPQVEWDFWRAEDTLAAMPEERQNFVVGARNRFAAIEEHVAFVAPGDEVIPGIEAVDTAGHTPGHTSYVVHGGGESIMILGDAMTNSVISFERPDWRIGTDQDPDMAAERRKMLLDRIAADRTRILGFHLPYPGRGTAERSGQAYRFVPA